MEPALSEHDDPRTDLLAGAEILLVEDQPEVATRLQAAVEDAGGRVVAVAATVESALGCIASEHVSAAIVTMIANGEYTDLVARELLRRGIPYVVTTGIGTDRSHPELHAALTVTKPFQPSYLQAVLAVLVAPDESCVGL